MRKFIIVAGAMLGLLAPSVASAAPASPAYTSDTVGSCGGTQNGSVTFAKGAATFHVPDTQSYAVLKVPQTGLKVKDIKTLGFKSLSSAGGGMVYMNVITNDGHKIKYTPYAQTPSIMEPGIGSWYSHNMLTSGVRINDDDSTPTVTWADAVTAFGNETINRVSITAGCSMGFGTVQVDRIQVNNSVVSFN